MLSTLPIVAELCSPQAPRLNKRSMAAVKAHLHNIDSSCHWCGRYVEGRNSTIDHIVPRSKGGGDEPGNLALCCNTCNTVKGDHDVVEWLTIVEAMAMRLRAYVWAECGSTG